VSVLAEGLARLVEVREREVRASTAREIADLIDAERRRAFPGDAYRAGLLTARKIADRVADVADRIDPDRG